MGKQARSGPGPVDSWERLKRELVAYLAVATNSDANPGDLELPAGHPLLDALQNLPGGLPTELTGPRFELQRNANRLQKCTTPKGWRGCRREIINAASALLDGVRRILTGTPAVPAALTQPAGGTEEGEGDAGSERAESRSDAFDETIPDASGYVKKPADTSAYLSASEVLRKHTPAHIAHTYKQLRSILNRNPDIKRWQQRKNRLAVHLADWNGFVERTERNLRAAGDGFDVTKEEAEARKAELRRLRKSGK